MVVIRGKDGIHHITAEAGADEQTNPVIWAREWKGNVSNLKQSCCKWEQTP
jgi:hypothetical protein